MQDNLITCPRCTSNACYEYQEDSFKMYHCFGCGFTSNSHLINGETTKNFITTLPELYKSLIYIDESGLSWYPSTINLENLGMVFADGTGALNWKWAAIMAVPIEENEKNKFPKTQTHKMDMKTLKHFDEKDFMEALDYIGYFNQIS